MKSAFEKLQSSQSRLGEAIYASAQQDAGSAAGAPADDQPASAGTDEDIVDAEVVDEDTNEKK